MTLRRQFHLLLAAVVAVPLLCVSLGPLYHWTHPAERASSPPLTSASSPLPAQDGNEKHILMPPQAGERSIESIETQRKRRRRNRLWIRLYVPLCAFIVFILYLILRLSRTIFSSISVLEEKTRLIANGNLDVVLASGTDGGGGGAKHKARETANEITSSTENLEKMRLSLLDLKERRTRFIMGMSHDLRTPVAVIKGYAEAITDGVVSTAEEVGNAAAIISGKAGQLDSMMEELISFVKLDSSDWRKSQTSVPLSQVLQDFAREALSTGTVFCRNVKSRIEADGVMVKMDKRMFTRMMENLFNNAIRYSSNGDTIEINAVRIADTCCIDVCDTGIGIEASELERIFDMFERGSHSRREDGMGIGLAVVKSVADAHGWSIAVRSKVGEGTVFSISIPVDIDNTVIKR